MMRTETSATGTAVADGRYDGFTDEERGAMKERAGAEGGGPARHARGQGGGRGERGAHEGRRAAGGGAGPCRGTRREGSELSPGGHAV